MRMSFHFYNPTRIVFGSGTLNELGNQALPGKKALLLMSCGKSAKVNGAYDRTLEQLKKAGVEVAEFAKVMENPLKDMVMEGAAFAKDNGCDFIVALGGGAVLDSATAISAMATNEGDLWDYVCGGTGKDKPLSASRSACGDDHAYGRNGLGNQLLGRYFQSGNSGKNRFWRSDAQSCSRHCGPGTDEDDSCALYGVSGL